MQIKVVITEDWGKRVFTPNHKGDALRQEIIAGRRHTLDGDEWSAQDVLELLKALVKA